MTPNSPKRRARDLDIGLASEGELGLNGVRVRRKRPGRPPTAGAFPGEGARWGVWFSTAASTLLPAHRHPALELNLIMTGSVVYRVEGRAEMLEAGAGEVLAIPAGQRHRLVHSSDDVVLWVLELNAAGSLGWAEQAVSCTPTEAWRRRVVLAARKLWLRPPTEEALVLQGDLWRDLLGLQRAGRGRPPTVHPAVAQAKAVCERLRDGQLDVSELAREAGLSSSRLSHLFAEQLGVTPLQYRNFARIQYFIQSYDGDERNLLGAALRAGFGSYAQFHRTFRQVCGEAPALHFKWLTSSPELASKRTLASTAAVATPAV